MRIFLFLATNIAIMVVAGTVFRLLGFESILMNNGVDLDLGALLVFCALFGMGGSMVSLLLSKWMAKSSTGAQVIEAPSSNVERWLLQTVERLSKDAGIGMPEVAVFNSDMPNAFATGAKSGTSADGSPGKSRLEEEIDERLGEGSGQEIFNALEGLLGNGRRR